MAIVCGFKSFAHTSMILSKAAIFLIRSTSVSSVRSEGSISSAGFVITSYSIHYTKLYEKAEIEPTNNPSSIAYTGAVTGERSGFTIVIIAKINPPIAPPKINIIGFTACVSVNLHDNAPVNKTKPSNMAVLLIDPFKVIGSESTAV